MRAQGAGDHNMGACWKQVSHEGRTCRDGVCCGLSKKAARPQLIPNASVLAAAGMCLQLPGIEYELAIDRTNLKALHFVAVAGPEEVGTASKLLIHDASSRHLDLYGLQGSGHA